MATASQPGVGGKVVAKRREQRLATTPYDRPPPKNPSWFRGTVIPSALRIASGAGRILNSIFESDSSESEDEGYASVDSNPNNDGHPASTAVLEENATPSQRLQGMETKQLIEKLIGQENFSWEEFDRLTNVLKSRVVDRSEEARDGSLFIDTPANAVHRDDVDAYEKAIQEAKSWFQDKRVGSTSSDSFAHGNTTCATSVDHGKHGEGSPVDVAKFYMKERAPWSSPTGHAELQTPFVTAMKFFKEGTTHSVGYDSLSLSKKRSYLASGSWNIEEEKRRVRSKAIDDVLRASSSSKLDPVSFSLSLPHESLGTGKALLVSGEKMAKPDVPNKTNPTDALLDAGMSSGLGLADTCSLETDEPAPEVDGNPTTANGFSSSKSRTSAEEDKPQDDEKNAADPINETKPQNTNDLEGDSTLLTHMEEVPVVAETDIGSESSLGVQREELSPSVWLPPKKPKSRKPSKQASTKVRKR